MKAISGVDLAARIHSSSDGCPKCGTNISFIGGLKTARDAGIQYNVLMCPKCRNVYEVDVTLGGFTFRKNVTVEFAQVLGLTLCASCDGRGKHECSKCDGLGYLEFCSKCKGKKTIPCGCRQGMVDCFTCKGSGKQPALFGIFKTACKTCTGSGMIEHAKCSGSGVVVCGSCYGKGMLRPCPECSTKGKWNCKDCSGYGWKAG